MPGQTHDHLDDTDKMLLGEMAVKALTTEQVSPKTDGRDDHEHIQGHDYNPLTATQGTLVKTDHKGNLVQNEQVDDLAKDTTATHKKRGVSPSDGIVDDYPVKKRPSSRKKQTDSGGAKPVIASKKSIASDKNYNGAVIKSEQDDKHGNIGEPVTPPRTKRVTANGKVTPVSTSNNNPKSGSPSKSNGLTAKSTPRKRNAPKGGIADQRGIPISWDEADDADKMMFTMKDEGASWSVIREKWTAMTGIETAPSTLPNRLNRMRVHMMHFREGDDTLFIQMKQEVEDSLEREKWQNIANKMRANNAKYEYPIAFLQKKDKEFQEAVQKGTAPRAICNAMKGVFGTGDASNEDTDVVGEEEGVAREGSDKD